MQGNNKTIFAPSLLSADFSNFREALKTAESQGGDWIHLDVMDGSFVPDITFGHKMVKDIRKYTELPLDVHLMTMHPETLIDRFAEAGADYITFHLEAAVHSHRLLQRVRELGCRAGISIVPATPVNALSELLPFADLVLIMSVNPGYGGQSIILETLEKVRYLKEIREERNFRYLISVDGGINRNTAPQVREKGADVLISGSAFFGSSDPAAEAALIKGNKEV